MEISSIIQKLKVVKNQILRVRRSLVNSKQQSMNYHFPTFQKVQPNPKTFSKFAKVPYFLIYLPKILYLSLFIPNNMKLIKSHLQA